MLLISGNCDEASQVFTTKAAGSFKWPLAVGRYPATCLQMVDVMLTLFGLGSKVSVTAVLPIDFLILAQEGL